MAISIKLFSPLQSGTPDYFLNSDTYLGGELMFTNASSTLNCVILRKDYTNTGRYYILQSSVLTGYNNGTANYDYRLDIGNKIKIVHDPDVFIKYASTTAFAEIHANINHCSIYISLGTNDILSDMSASITTLSNGEKYVTSLGDFGNAFNDTFNFYDHSKQNLYISDLYTNSNLAVVLDSTASTYTITDVQFYDSANSSITGYGSDTDRTSDEDYNTLYLFVVPPNAVKAIVSYTVSGTSYTITKTLKGCASNQYVYFGKTQTIDTLYCTGKREKIEEITREYVKFSGKQRPISIKKQVSYDQNVGHGITEDKIFDLSVAPFIVEYNSSWGYEIYNIDNSTFEGLNTKSLSERNFVLTIKKDNEDRRNTSFLPNFYS